MTAADPTAVLAVPPGWVLDPLVGAVLQDALADAAADVVGVAARRAELEPGTSDRGAAERSVLGAGGVSPAPGPSIDGAVLLRAGTPHDVVADGVDVPAGQVLVVGNAVVHDARAPAGPVGAIHPEARPPFAVRPVVALVGSDADADAVPWAARLVDELIDVDVEARLVIDGAPDTPSPRRTRPCLATPEALAALRPDVVIALDERAQHDAERWCEGLRSTVFARYDAQVATVELVSWRLGEAQGRLRALVGRDVGAAELAALVNRLASGPVPGPPVDRDQPVTLLGRRGRRGRRRATLPPAVAIVGPDAPDPATERRIEALVAGWRPADSTVQRVGASDLATAEAADVLLVVGASATADVRDLVTRRAGLGRPNVVEVRRGDLEPADDPWDLRPRDLLPEADAVVAVAGRALFATVALERRTLLGPVHRLVLPTPISAVAPPGEPADADEPTPDADASAGPALSWHLGACAERRGGDDLALVDAVGAALATLLDVVGGMTLHLVGEVRTVPAALFDDDRVQVSPGRLAHQHVRRSELVLVTPTVLDVLDGEPAEMVGAPRAGLPTAWAFAGRGREAWLPRPAVTWRAATDVDGWVDALRPLLVDAGARAALRDEGIAKTDDLVSPAGFQRLADWAGGR